MPADPVAHGGVLLAVHRGLPSQHLELRTPLQAVAARVLFDHRVCTICSIYLPPGCALPESELSRLVAELPSPMLILGDFNGHHTLWGCREIDVRGRVLERFILNEHLVILNTGTRTHVTMPSGSTSALDLSLLSPQLAPLFTWEVADDPMGSDHFPVLLKYNSIVSLGTRPQRWNIRKADWDGFEAASRSFPLAPLTTLQLRISPERSSVLPGSSSQGPQEIRLVLLSLGGRRNAKRPFEPEGGPSEPSTAMRLRKT